jgi:hypothetical protein
MTYQGSRVDLHASTGKKSSRSSTSLAEKNAELIQNFTKNEKSSSPVKPLLRRVNGDGMKAGSGHVMG